jgi:uncharacterized membrane protein YqjE
MDTEPHPAAPRGGGLFDRARRVLASLLALAETRLALVTTEIQEELNRLASMLLWALVAIFFSGLTILAAGALLVIALWDQYRLWAAGSVVLVFAAIAAFAGWRMRARLAAGSPLLAGSLAELRRDHDALAGRE